MPALVMLIAMLACSLAAASDGSADASNGAAPNGTASDGRPAVYHEAALLLEGALPNTNPKLHDDLELYLGRSAQGGWRPWVMGYSAFIDTERNRVHAYKRYNWIDDEGVVTSAADEGGRVELTIEMTIHPDPWVAGGTLRARLVLDRDEDGGLRGRYEGVFERAKQSAAGAAGTFNIAGDVRGRIDANPWPSVVADWEPVSPGEHPRLLFRKSDVPALRARMKTDMGKWIVSALTRRLASDDDDENSWRGYGYGLMYQLTGDEAWAAKGRAFCEAVIAGKLQSPRYGWRTRDGGYMRIGPTAAAVAATYDMCYDAWEPEVRQWVAGQLQQRIWPNMAISPDRAESDAQYSPRSNHYLLWNGGAGFATLAILGDPGVDDRIMQRADHIFQQRLKRGLAHGYGDHGWFYEGTFCGRFPANIAAAQYLQALRVARGLDYVEHSSEARWLVTRWLYEAVRSGGSVRYYPRGMYDRIDDWAHFNGDFALGFGILPAAHRAPALWFCRRILHPDRPRGIDATGVRALVYAFVNWPADLEPRDPAQVLSRTLFDREARFFVFRSGWEGEGDVIVTMHGDTRVIGMGLETGFAMGIPVGQGVDVYDFEARDDGVTIVAAREDGPGDEEPDFHFVADFSGLSGAKALLVGLLPETGRRTVEQAMEEMSPEKRRGLEAVLRSLRRGEADQSTSESGAADAREANEDRRDGQQTDKARAESHEFVFHGRTLHVMTIQKGPGSTVRIAGEGDDAAIIVGQRRITFNGRKLVVGRAE